MTARPFYNVAQLAELSGLSVRSIHHHVQHRWLKAEDRAPGIRSLRFTHYNASKWFARHFPDKTFPSSSAFKPYYLVTN